MLDLLYLIQRNACKLYGLYLSIHLIFSAISAKVKPLDKKLPNNPPMNIEYQHCMVIYGLFALISTAYLTKIHSRDTQNYFTEFINKNCEINCSICLVLHIARPLFPVFLCGGGKRVW